MDIIIIICDAPFRVQNYKNNTNHRIYRLQKVLSVLQKENCSALQKSHKIATKMKCTANFIQKHKKFAMHCIFYLLLKEPSIYLIMMSLYFLLPKPIFSA